MGTVVRTYILPGSNSYTARTHALKNVVYVLDQSSLYRGSTAATAAAAVAAASFLLNF